MKYEHNMDKRHVNEPKPEHDVTRCDTKRTERLHVNAVNVELLVKSSNTLMIALSEDFYLNTSNEL